MGEPPHLVEDGDCAVILGSRILNVKILRERTCGSIGNLQA